MDDGKQAEVARLLAEGLEQYGEDAIGKAIQSWRQVLAIDPHNPEALDYIQTADRRDRRSLPPEEQMSDTARQIAHAAEGLIERGDWEGALDMLRAVDGEPASLEYEAMVELVRSRLLREYTERIGNRDGVPALRGAAADLTGFNLPSDAGFMISLIDGTTRLSDLISLCGMDAFEALRIVINLLDADIVEMRG